MVFRRQIESIFGLLHRAAISCLELDLIIYNILRFFSLSEGIGTVKFCLILSVFQVYILLVKNELRRFLHEIDVALAPCNHMSCVLFVYRTCLMFLILD